MKTYTIKPLEWEIVEHPSHHDTYRAITNFYRYELETMGEKGYLRIYTDETDHRYSGIICASLADGKMKAQEHHEKWLKTYLNEVEE